jgi:lysophospholipase L1-like esterase
MAELAKAHRIVPILAGGPPAADYPGRTGPEPARQIVALNAWAKRYCAASGCIFLDYHAPLAGSDGQMKAGLSDDGVHPNARGYALLEPLVERAISDALKAWAR